MPLHVRATPHRQHQLQDRLQDRLQLKPVPFLLILTAILLLLVFLNLPDIDHKFVALFYFCLPDNDHRFDALFCF